MPRLKLHHCSLLQPCLRFCNSALLLFIFDCFLSKISWTFCCNGVLIVAAGAGIIRHRMCHNIANVVTGAGDVGAVADLEGFDAVALKNAGGWGVATGVGC